ncbi:agrin-like [Ruditapes philippinarum]|uniref:agrin-like n=1 Tax=Ruditapes philippinarum TaxID=129788 RepID=UPI00295A78E8|nr:agrin-like [Ruditapes philippinarum]
MDISCILFHILMISACSGGGSGGGHVTHCLHSDCGVQEAIEYIVGGKIDSHLCHALKNVDCNHHILIHDGMICATDGKTYRNHCEYANATCLQSFDKHNYPLAIASHGPCRTSSTSTVASTKSTTLSVNTGRGPDVSTVSVDNVLKSIFCKNVWSINCGQDFSIVCGSDGKYYPNECELLKWQCDNPLLRKASDTSVCG